MAGKVALGILTVLPGIYMIGFFSFMFGDLFLGWPTSRDLVQYIFAVHFAMMILLMALAVIYIRHIYRNTRLTPDQKTFWVVLIIFCNALSMPVYWYHYCLKEDVQ